MTSGEQRPVRSSFESIKSSTAYDDDPSFDARSSSSKSPRRSSEGKSSIVQELLSRLHREEKARELSSAMLAEIEFSPHGSERRSSQDSGNFLPPLRLDRVSPEAATPQSRASVIHTVRQFALLKTSSPEAQRKKLKSQVETSDNEIREIQRQLRDFGIDEDDEVSSGDEEAPSGIANSMLMTDDYNIGDDDLRHIIPSAASSTTDLTSAYISNSAYASSGGYSSSSHHNGSTVSLVSTDAVNSLMVLLDALDHRHPDVFAAIERVCKFVQLTPKLKLELQSASFWAVAVEKLKPFLLDKNASTRCLGFRLLRLFILDAPSFVYYRNQLCLELQFAQVLSREDHDRNHELRLTVIQLIRVIINLDGGAAELSQNIYRALVAVAEQHNDGTRHICIETLAELLVIDAERVFEAGAIQLLLRIMTDPGETPPRGGKLAFSLALAMGFLDACDRPEIRRRYLRNGRDISSLLTNFTDVHLYGFVTADREMLQTSAAVMSVLMRSWVGVFLFNFPLFVECMVMPVESIQATLLGVLDHVLWLPQTPENLSANAPSAKTAPVLLCQFTAILLRNLQDAGLQEKLVTLQNEGATDEIKQRAELLGSKVFTLSARLIPSYDIVPKSMALSAKLASELATQPIMSLPTTSVSIFGTERKLREMPELQPPKPGIATFVRFGVAIDDASFKKLVNATHILDTKLFRQWNWDAIMELVQGPLRSPKRFDELTRSSKFLKRLLSFYRPFKYRFSNLPITKEHLRYVKVGKEMVKSLLETTEGARYLAQNKLFRQIAECLAQLDPLSGIMSNEPLFSVRRFRTTLCCAYAEFIGVLSKSTAGQQILAQIRIFNMLYRVCDINREDVMRAFICALNYRLEGHPRLILAKALSASMRSTRLFATEFVGVRMAQATGHGYSVLWAVDLLVEQLYDVEMAIAHAAAVGLLNICAQSEACLDYLISKHPFIDHLGEPLRSLQILFMGRPGGFEVIMEKLKKQDVMKWASEHCDAYVDKIEGYLEAISDEAQRPHLKDPTSEPFLFPTYARPSKRQNDAQLEPPAHFYGELALTDEGCRFLQSMGLIAEFHTEVDAFASDLARDWTRAELRRMSAILWAIGHVASRPKGVLLLDLDLVRKLCDICLQSQIYSVKGTTFYVLGMFAFSLSGAELLQQCGWDVVYDIFSRPLGVALPPASYATYLTTVPPPMAPSPPHRRQSVKMRSPVKRRAKSVSRSPVKSASTRSLRSHQESEIEDPVSRILAPSMSSNSLVSPQSPNAHFDFEIDPSLSSRRSSCFDLLEFPSKRDESLEVVLHAISQLGSSVLSQSATKRLVAMRASQPSIFQREDLTREVLNILGTGNYRQVTRRFIFELIDVFAVLERVYKRNRTYHAPNGVISE